MYFGAAKNLKNVKEVFEKEMPEAPVENERQLQKLVDNEYLGLKKGTPEEETKRLE